MGIPIDADKYFVLSKIRDGREERGYAILIVMILMFLGVIAVTAALQTSADAGRTALATKQRSDRFYKAESALSESISWLREHSDSLISLFKQDTFYSHFERTEPSIGSNDHAYSFPSKIKLSGTTDSVVLSNNTTLASSNFPDAVATDGSTFSTQSQFANLNFDGQLVKITLLDAIAKDPSKDYGPPPAATPKTDFYPVFRIDAMSGTDRGGHVYGYFVGKLVNGGAHGFYGKQYVDARQDCDSYDSSEGNYSGGIAHANCPVSSGGSICIQNNANIYGTVETTDAMSTSGSCGGDICTDLACGQHGTACEGSSCESYTMPVYQSWTSYCPAGIGLGNVSVAAHDTTTLTAGGSAATHCWGTVTVANHGTLVLTSTANPYYISTLDMNDTLNINPDNASGKVTLYVLSITGNKINGNQVVNSTARASQFQLIYLGTAELKLNGNADMQMMVVAPYAGVEILGNSDFSGGVIADYLKMTGNARVHYDESGEDSGATDFKLIPRLVTQYYR